MVDSLPAWEERRVVLQEDKRSAGGYGWAGQAGLSQVLFKDGVQAFLYADGISACRSAVLTHIVTQVSDGLQRCRVAGLHVGVQSIQPAMQRVYAGYLNANQGAYDGNHDGHQGYDEGKPG